MSLTRPPFNMIIGMPLNVLDFGADKTGVADSSSSINAAITEATANGGGTVYFPSGTYLIETQVVLNNNIELTGDMGAKILVGDAMPLQAILGTNINNIKINGLVFEASGTVYTDGNQRILQFNSCNEIIITDCTFRKARESGVVIDNCSQGRIDNCLFENNYGYGGTLRNGCVSWTISNCLFYQNGNTGIATSTYGRGWVLWEATRVDVSNCTFKDNSEYGFRIYSQVGDSDISQNITVSGCSFENNGTSATSKIDLYIYNELGTLENIAISNCTFRTRADNTAIAVQGDAVSITNCVIKAAVANSGTAFNVYRASNVIISNCVVRNMYAAVSLSGTAGNIPNNVRISDNQFIDITTISQGVYGANTIFSNNYFKQSASGLAALVTGLFADDTGSTGTRVIGNTFDGFYRAIQINIDVCDIEFSNNNCVNTGDLTVRCYGTNLTNLTFVNNSLDVGTNPTILGKMQRTRGTYPTVLGKTNVTPTDFAFAQGDVFYDIGATASGTAGWICTTAGTPGTWKRFGTIEA